MVQFLNHLDDRWSHRWLLQRTRGPGVHACPGGPAREQALAPPDGGSGLRRQMIWVRAVRSAGRSRARRRRCPKHQCLDSRQARGRAPGIGQNANGTALGLSDGREGQALVNGATARTDRPAAWKRAGAEVGIEGMTCLSGLRHSCAFAARSTRHSRDHHHAHPPARLACKRNSTTGTRTSRAW